MKKNLIKGAILVLSLTLTMGLFASCGGNGGDTEGKTSIVIATDADYDTLHASNTSSSVENHITAQIYDTLLVKNYEDPNQLDPRVADSWEISEDGKCYTFHLNKDATFHNGDPVTAEDVGFTLDLFADSQYQGAAVDGLDHYDIIDEHTIAVYTTEVYAPFLSSMSQVWIASKNYYETAGEEAFAQEPIGCGPYKWVSHDIGDKTILQAYDDYYRGAPVIKEITFKVISDVASMGIAIQSGDVDFAEIDASIMSTLEGDENVQLLQAEQTTFAFVAMNTEKKPYSDVKFRQAINYAINREALVESVQEGLGTVNSNLLTPDREGYSDDQIKYTYDVDKAKDLLAEAGVAEGTDLGTMYVAEQYKLLAQMIQSDLEAVGLTTKIEILEFNAYLDKLRQGDFGLTVLQMSLQGNTQQMSMAVTSEYIGMANNARYSNPEIDALFVKAAATIDEGEREAIYEEIFTKIQEDAVYAVLYNPTMLFGANANLKVHHLPLEGDYFIFDFAW